MIRVIQSIIAVCLLGMTLAVNAAIDTYEFKDEVTRTRFNALAAELRCPKCQNQNIADSNSPIAKDLRDELHRMLQAGESDSAIVDFMVTRYGEFVLYNPRVSEQTYLLWYGPAALLLIGIAVVLVISRKRKKTLKGQKDHLSADDQRRLNDLLKQDDNK